MGFTRKNDSSGKNILIDTQVLGSSNHPCSQSQWDKQCPGRSPNQAHSSPGQQSGCRPFQRYRSKHVGHFYRLPPRETTQKVYMQICKKINFWDEVIHWELKLLKSYVYICMHGNCYIYTIIPNRNRERKNHPWQQHTVFILYIYIYVNNSTSFKTKLRFVWTYSPSGTQWWACGYTFQISKGS